MSDCPCGTGRPLADCCQPFIDGEKQPDTAEELLRSRYTAHATHAIDYIGKTIHPDMRHDWDREASRQWAEGATWKQLEVVSVKGGGPDEERGVIEFIARFDVEDVPQEHHEIAIFRRSGKAWTFHDGRTVGSDPVVRESPKVGRNDPCPCGSGKKHKKCCGAGAA